MPELLNIRSLLAASHVVLFDTEYTSWPGALERGWSGPGEHREIVQIGGILLDRRFEEIGSFSQLVRPAVNPVLSQYFTDLTGITNVDVEARGALLTDVLDQFAAFCSRSSLVCAFGPDDEVIQENCDLLGLKNPMVDTTVVDIRSCLCGIARVRTDETDCSRLPLAFGLPQQPQSHDALADARAVASVLRYLKSRASAGRTLLYMSSNMVDGE